VYSLPNYISWAARGFGGVLKAALEALALTAFLLTKKVHFAEKGEGGQFWQFCADVHYGQPLTKY